MDELDDFLIWNVLDDLLGDDEYAKEEAKQMRLDMNRE